MTGRPPTSLPIDLPDEEIADPCTQLEDAAGACLLAVCIGCCALIAGGLGLGAWLVWRAGA